MVYFSSVDVEVGSNLERAAFDKVKAGLDRYYNLRVYSSWKNHLVRIQS